ncbi:hypothetical protein OG21DRAFT_1499838 [Imleria badia]|nr:hypothetical protein OG21DRAFT_1499838 [Imleria badia]
MFANAKSLLVIASCALVAQAQSSGNASASATAPASTSSTPALPDSCIIECLNPAAVQYGCGTYSNLTCVCTSTAYEQAALSCLQANCTAADVTAAVQSQEEVCGALYPSGSVPVSIAASTAAPSGTPSPSASTSPASTPASSGTSSTTASATSSSAASASFSLGILVVTLVASAGTLVGAAFVL